MIIVPPGSGDGIVDDGEPAVGTDVDTGDVPTTDPEMSDGTGSEEAEVSAEVENRVSITHIRTQEEGSLEVNGSPLLRQKLEVYGD